MKIDNSSIERVEEFKFRRYRVQIQEMSFQIQEVSGSNSGNVVSNSGCVGFKFRKCRFRFTGCQTQIREMSCSNSGGVGFKFRDIRFDHFEFSRFEFKRCLDQIEEAPGSNLFWIIGYFVLEISRLSCPFQVPP